MTTALRQLLPAHATVEVAVTEIGWSPDGDMSYEQWEQAGHDLLRMGRAWQWWLGDWILYGEQRYGEKYTEAIEVTGLEYKTIANVISVARQVESSRRRETLSWSHHAEVAALEPAEQTAWLDVAEQEGMTRERLRSALRAQRIGDQQPDPEPEPAKASFVGELAFTFAAVDQDHAQTKVKDLADLLERHGVSITYKHAKARAR